MTKAIVTVLVDHVLVELEDATNPHGTASNYGVVSIDDIDGVFRWGIASGTSGTADTRDGAVRAATRALRRAVAEDE